MRLSGPKFCVKAVALFCTAILLSCENAGDTPQPSVEEMVSRAGNTESEKERYRILIQLRGRLGSMLGLRTDLDRLLPVVDRWANGRGKYWTPGDAQYSYLGRFFHMEVLPALPLMVDKTSPYYPFWPLIQFYFERVKPTYPPEVCRHSPFYPLWCLYRGRMLIQQPIQNEQLIETGELQDVYYGQGRRLLEVARKAFPQNRTIGMYLDDPVPWPAIHPPDPAAPEWANLQREILEKLADIMAFWIDKRQAPDGQFGGGWGDDVEMWRNWTPILIGFEDPKLNAAQERLADGLFALDRMAGGYTGKMSDVEHTGEDSGDTGAAMMHIAPDSPVWRTRARRIAELMRDLWTGRNQRGFLQFKSTYFNVREVDLSPRHACDTAYHPRAVQPALLYWQRTGDPDLTERFSAWMDTWVDATAREERGKPAGVLPSAVHWPDGRVGGLGANWWDPENCGEPALYRWPSAMTMLTSTLLLTSHMTGNARYLSPIESMAAIRTEYLTHPPQNPAPGSAMWCAEQMGGFLSDTLAKYRLLTGNRRFDPLLLADVSGYVRYRLTGNRQFLLQHLMQTVRAFRVNREAYCSEVRWTDRVFSFHRDYANRYADAPVPDPGLNTLYSSITGDFGNPLYFPMNAVRWKTPPQDIAALVTDHSTAHLSAELYHFGNAPRAMGADLYLLDRGEYGWALASGGQNLSQGRIRVESPRTTVRFVLPARRLCEFQVRPPESSTSVE